MYSLNRATILGNVVRDPEIRQTTSGQHVCSFSLATNRAWTDSSGAKQEQADFHNIVAWGKLAEICGQYLAKGRKVYIEGRMQTRDWQGQDGVKRYRTEIVADNMILLDRAGSAQGGASRAPASVSAQSARLPNEQGSSFAAEQPKDDPAIEEEIKVEDIPF